MTISISEREGLYNFTEQFIIVDTRTSFEAPEIYLIAIDVKTSCSEMLSFSLENS